MRGATPFFMALLFAATEYRAVAAQGGGGGAKKGGVEVRAEGRRWKS